MLCIKQYLDLVGMGVVPTPLVADGLGHVGEDPVVHGHHRYRVTTIVG